MDLLDHQRGESHPPSLARRRAEIPGTLRRLFALWFQELSTVFLQEEGLRRIPHPFIGIYLCLYNIIVCLFI